MLGPVLCMVSDLERHGGEEAWLERVEAASAAGVQMIQIRERGLEAGALTRLVRRCLRVVDHRRTRVVVNDRLDVALAAGADGVHLRGDSMPAPRARTLAPRPFLIGRAVRGADEAQAAVRTNDVDYVTFGTVFASQSKPGGAAAGTDALADVVRAVDVPVLAIGGINTTTIGRVAGTGASGVAAIDLFRVASATDMRGVVSIVLAAFVSRPSVTITAPTMSTR